MSTIRTIGVIGAGQMGAGIAQVSAQAGYQTLLFDSVKAAQEKGMASIAAQLDKAVGKGKLADADRQKTLGILKGTASMSDLAGCDLVIEAIIENIEVKTKVFAELDTIVKPEGILASNTSSIAITKIAAATKRPSQVMGMHFMNPVPVMKLVELIRGLQTSDRTYETCREVCEKMGKTTVLAIDNAGFVVNRILVPMINEAIFVLQEGVKPEDIDNAMKLGTNQPMGPLELADFVGLDTLLYILHVLHDELGEDKYRPCPLLIRYVEAGWYGRKSGRGFYQYS